MTTKLTLTIDDKVIKSAKKYAQKQGKSLSHLVENYLKSLASDTTESSKETLSPKVLKLMGIIKLRENFDYKVELGNILSKKKTR
jgi:predicted HicB family RNase H-like nuclease